MSSGPLVTSAGQICWSVRELLFSENRKKAAKAMKLVTLNNNPTMADAMAVIDALRADVQSGKVIAFVVAGLDAEDATFGYSSSVKPVSRLRMQGAMTQALSDFVGGAF